MAIAIRIMMFFCILSGHWNPYNFVADQISFELCSICGDPMLCILPNLFESGIWGYSFALWWSNSCFRLKSTKNAMQPCEPSCLKTLLRLRMLLVDCKFNFFYWSNREENIEIPYYSLLLIAVCYDWLLWEVSQYKNVYAYW